jgi:hypothetical protein
MSITRLVLAIALAAPIFVEAAPVPQRKPGPYIVVYHDDRVAFQMRRDRIERKGEAKYVVWLRWLYAKGQPWKSDTEVARTAVTEIDCTRLRVRELGVLHRNAAGKVFDVEEADDHDSVPWRQLDRKSGAASAIAQVCEFVPQLLATAEKK